MGSSRFILALLGIIFLVIVVLSSSKLIDAIRKKTGFKSQNEQVSEAQISITPTPFGSNTGGNTKILITPDNPPITKTDYKGSEIPSTGPNEIVYLLLGSGILTGAYLKKFRG